MKKAVALLRGEVRVRIDTPFPERVLNLCAARGIAFSSVSRPADTALVLTLERREWRLLRAALRALDARWRVERRRGAPYFLAGFRRRYALAAGLALVAALLWLNARCIWDVQVTGNETVPTETILRVLKENGVCWGARSNGLRPQEICNRVLLEIPELAWLTVNVRGCRANVQVVERVKKPTLDDRSEPADIVAAKTALVTRVLPYDGRACVLPGQTVLCGDVLISGTVDTEGTENPSVPRRLLSGAGEVWGRTWYELSVLVPLQYEAREYDGGTSERFYLLWNEKRVKIFGKGSSQSGMDCDRITTRRRLTLPGGIALPAVLVHESERSFRPVTLCRTREQAAAQGYACLRAYLRTLLDENGSVTSGRFACAEQGDALLVTLSAECMEQIGVRVPIAAP